MTRATGLNPGLPRKGWGRSQKTSKAGAPAKRGIEGQGRQARHCAFEKRELGSQTGSRGHSITKPPIKVPLNTAYNKSICVFTAMRAYCSHLENSGWKVLSLPSESLRNSKSEQ